MGCGARQAAREEDRARARERERSTFARRVDQRAHQSLQAPSTGEVVSDPKAQSGQAEFDRYAKSYEEMHAQNVELSGEGTEYFAIYKQKVLERLLGKGFEKPVLDFGCGIGNLI